MDFEGSRRGFLKTVGLALAGILGAVLASGQDQKEKTAKDEKKEKDRDKEKEKGDAKTESGTAAKKDAARGEGKKDERDTPPAPKDDVTDEIRICPQCGAAMYRQGRVWTCDTCGYSYVE